MSDTVTISLPISTHVLEGIGFAFLFAALSAIAFFALPDRDRKTASSKFNSLHAIGVLATLLAPIWLWLIGHILWSLWSLAQDYNPAVQDNDLRWHILAFVGLITALGAMVSAPLALIRVWTTERQTRTAEQGHMTDRISKAVEQLGAEKTVDRIGRPVTIWTGKTTRTGVADSVLEKCLSQPRSKQTNKEWSQSYNEITDEVWEGTLYTVTQWEEERTTIQWQGTDLQLEKTETVGSEGSWQVFRETVPNIEVRIGGLLSLERIAQDSVRYDAGRDHVRVMEILCAYVRENAPASNAKNAPVPLEANDESIEGKRQRDLFHWSMSLDPPRADVQMALTIIGRRGPEQIEIERTQKPDTRKMYSPDLSRTSLQKANLEGLDFSTASFYRSHLEGAFCKGANLSRCNFIYGKLSVLSGDHAILSGAKFDSADLSQASLRGAELYDCSFSLTHCVRTNFDHAKIKFIENSKAQMVNRSYFVDASFKNAALSGDLIGTVFSFQLREEETFPRQLAQMNLRNARYSQWGRVFDQQYKFQAFDGSWLDAVFGDGSVEMVEDDRPLHWPSARLTDDDFHNEYEKWCADPHGYVPPSNPSDKTSE